MAFLDPYAVNGATVTGAHLRRETFRNTKGETGVDDPHALKVVAVPGSPGVAGIMPGGGLIANEARRETYSVTNLAMDGDALVDIPTAGSGGATHFVIVEVTDPEYHGDEPAATPLVVSSLSGRTRPFLPLARINLAAGEGFTTTSTVEDLRQVALPRKERYLFALNMPDDYQDEVLTQTSPGRDWPSWGTTDWRVVIPSWATHVQAVVTWAGVQVPIGDGPGSGQVYLRIGHSGQELRTEHTNWSVDGGGSGNNARDTWVSASTRPIPPEMRGSGSSWQVRPRAQVNAGAAGNARPRLTRASAVVVDIEFFEQAE